MEAPKPQDDAAAFLLASFAQGLRPPPRRTVAQWAEANRIVTEGAYEGPWRNARTPYLIEPMEKATLSNPARSVTIKGSAQLGKTNIGTNFLGQVLEETPAKVMVLLPSIDSVRMYNRDKLDPMLRNTPSLACVVADITSRDASGSTTTVKRGAREAQVELVTANSSANLQSRTVRALIMEEISEYPFDVDGRGDPVDQAMARTIQWRGRGEKVLYISTPGIKGTCRITKLYDAGSRAVFNVPCLRCGTAQPLECHRLTWREGRTEEAGYPCIKCDQLMVERNKPGMLAEGGWLHERPDLAVLHPSYDINTLYSPFTPWSEFAREAEKAGTDSGKLKTFTQQWIGKAWDEAYDLPKAEILLLRRDKWPPGRIPPAIVFLIGATDVQGDRLVWAVWGFDRDFGQWLIATGTIEGDPTRPDVWREHDALLKRRWTDAWGKQVAPDAWGVDAGYLSTHVYTYCRRHGDDTKPEVRALDGRDGWKLPPLGTPKRIDVTWQGAPLGSVRLWPVGTWDMKSELAAALRLTEQGPGPEGWPAGSLRYNETIDKAWLEELLAEQCQIHPKTGARAWKKVNARNEAWDLAVYARAQARHATMQLTDAEWTTLIALRQGAPQDAQKDLVELWAPDLKAQAEHARHHAPPPAVQAAAVRQGRGVAGPGRSVI